MTSSQNISITSKLTGIPKDLLRMWERRYGYPTPSRDSNGNRLYSSDQIDKLILIRQLMNRGKRPGKLVAMNPQSLREMLSDTPNEGFREETLMALLQQKDASTLRQWLQENILYLGLRKAIHQTIAPAISSVGRAWAQGEISIHEEHLFTEILVNLIRQQLADQRFQNPAEPKVMLTTVLGEKHGLGLLMVEALLRLGGAEVISFGTEMPFQEIREAAEQHQVHIIGLSFSGSFQGDDALVMLAGLRQIIHPDIQIWAGGAALMEETQPPEGVVLLKTLSSVERALSRWTCD